MLTGTFRTTATMAALVIGCTFILPDSLGTKAFAAPYSSSSPAASLTAQEETQSFASSESSFTVKPVKVDGKVTFVSQIN